MKLIMKICADSVDEIRAALKTFSEEQYDSNACGTIEGVDFDYEFVDNNDLYSDDGNKSTKTPNGEIKSETHCSKSEYVHPRSSS